ncbi:MAG TPA: MFS transporter [Isosphaeraceae bacterium]|nr:MFS transporter [Isosphaeraceae bacterium]
METPSQEATLDGNAEIPGGSDSALAGRRMVTAALLVAMMVTAMEQLVVSPAMPTIIAVLRGFDIYPWVISAYLLAATVSTPIYGKLADLFGRKRVLLFGLVLFSLGSILSGTSMSMGQLIAMRTLQGLGAGAVGPIVITMLGDLFTLHERARVQSLFSAVWGLSSVAGPILGGYLTDNVGWRWVFLVSVPFAVVAIFLLAWYVTEPQVQRQVAPIDWAGAGLLTAGLSALLLVVLDGSQHGVRITAGLLMASVALLVLFVIREHFAADPIFPIDLMTRPAIAASLVGSCLIGGILFGIDTYIPLYIQGVRGGDARWAGRALMPLFLSWAISVAVAARAVVHRGFRFGALVGSTFITVGTLGLVLGALVPEWSRTCFVIGLILTGMGMGPTSLSFILAVQHAVTWGQRGAATGAAIFLRTIGGAIGVGLLGATLGWELAHRLAGAGVSGIDVTAALRPETHALLSPDQLAVVQAQLGHTLRDVYLQMAVLGVGSVVCSLWLPGRKETLAAAAGPAEDELADEGLAVAASEL